MINENGSNHALKILAKISIVSHMINCLKNLDLKALLLKFLI